MLCGGHNFPPRRDFIMMCDTRWRGMEWLRLAIVCLLVIVIIPCVRIAEPVHWSAAWDKHRHGAGWRRSGERLRAAVTNHSLCQTFSPPISKTQRLRLSEILLFTVSRRSCLDRPRVSANEGSAAGCACLLFSQAFSQAFTHAQILRASSPRPAVAR
jgi:hypothetical protein